MTLAFVDEAAFQPTPVVVATWAPRGERPVMRDKQGNREKVSAISAVTHTKKLYFRLKTEEAINAEDVQAFVRLLLRHTRGRLAIIWDNAKQHHAKIVTAMTAKHSRLRIEFLPGYSPDFNPDEGVWDHSKVKELANFCPKDEVELLREARATLKRLKRRPTKIASFWRQTNLPRHDLESLLNIHPGG